MSTASKLQLRIQRDYAGQRLDVTLNQLLPEFSRSGIVNLINKKLVTIENIFVKPSYRLKGGEQVELVLEETNQPLDIKGQPIELDILYEDEDIIVINKDAGMVVHPAPGNYENTLVNALIHRFPQMNSFGDSNRPGIVHRLDKDTSGVMVVAKNQLAMNHLAMQFQSRSLQKKYLALVWGIPKQHCGEVNYAIGRHRTDRKKMSIHSRNGRSAVTLWKVKEHYAGLSLLEIMIKTGRTHQIRVHCAAIHHPVVGDPIYGGNRKAHLIKELSQEVVHKIHNVNRQMLHAWELKITHPRTLMPMTFKSPVPEDISNLVGALKVFQK